MGDSTIAGIVVANDLSGNLYDEIVVEDTTGGLTVTIKDNGLYLLYRVGDKVYIENDKGETLAFQVRRIQLFDRNADATTVFTSGDGLAHLNLITCEGVWDKTQKTYSNRLVVFTNME